jgi:uncharacterized protein (TIGR02996 family)
VKLVDPTASDFRLLVAAVLDNPQDDTPKRMLRDYLIEGDDPRAGLLLVRDEINADLSHIPPRLPYTHGDYAAPDEVRPYKGGLWNPHSSHRLLAIALVRKLGLWLFAEPPKRMTCYSSPETSPTRIHWEWFHRFLCAADMYSCRLISPLERDHRMRRQMNDAWIDPAGAMRDAINWWFWLGIDTPDWQLYAQISRLRRLFLACRGGKRRVREVYESVTAISREYGYGHAETHDTYRAITDTWSDYAPWKYEQQVRYLEDEIKEMRRAARPE